MPMPDNGFKWRPNDNSAQTLLRYELEAEKWVNAVSSAKSKAYRGSISKDLLVIGMVIQLILTIPLIILLLILKGVQGTLKMVREKRERNLRISEMRQKGYPESTINVLVDSPVRRRKGNALLFDSNGNFWFIWEFLFRFVFIFSFIFVFVAITVLFYDPDFNLLEETFLIIVACLSAWMAFSRSG